MSLSKLSFNIISSILKNKFNNIPIPGFVTFFNTDRCNRKCVFCDVWKTKNAKNFERKIDQIMQVFGKISEFNVFKISEGEPFLRTDISEVVNFVDQNIKPEVIHFTTNGVLINNLASISKCNIV